MTGAATGDARDRTSTPATGAGSAANPGSASNSGSPGVPDRTAELQEDALFPEMNPGPVCRLDLEGRVSRANPAAQAVFGSDLVGRRWKDVVPALTPELWDRIVGTGERVWLEAEVGGTHLGFTMARAPGSEHVFVYGTDISALKDAEHRLAELARFPDMNPGPVLRVDGGGTILLANRAARDLFGGTDLVGRRWPDLCPGVSVGDWGEMVTANAPVDHEARLGEHHMLFTLAPDPGIGQVFIYGADLTELKAAERALHQSERMATLGTLAAGVAHELNNPAAAVQRAAVHLEQALALLQEANVELNGLVLDPELVGRLAELDGTAREKATSPPDFDPLTRSDREEDVELWLEDRDLDDGWDLAPALVSLGYGPAELDDLADAIPEDRLGPVIRWMSRTFPVYSVVEEIRHGTSRIVEIVTALKAYSYVGRAPVQAVDVNEGIRNTLIILQNKLKRGVTVDLELESALPAIQAYGGELNQVWTNLIDNAADAMDGSGRLAVRTATEGTGVRVEVEDDGPGIPEDIQGRIFDPFFTTKDPGRGTGLGLNATYNTVVKKHGGSIELHSEPGRTRFIVRLPVTLDHAPHQER